MAKGFFITGTDTEIGKTTASLALMRVLKQQGYKVAGMKPVAAGCLVTTQGLRNDDAEKLRKESSIDLPYPIVNPFAYESPIAPHIAAAQVSQPIDINLITKAYEAIASRADVVIVEGVGGWAVPINESQTMADVAIALELPIILVSGIRLGCLNHTLLTYAAIESNSCQCAGWIANLLSDCNPAEEQNIEYLKHSLPIAYLGTLPYRHPDLPTLQHSTLSISLLNL